MEPPPGRAGERGWVNAPADHIAGVSKMVEPLMLLPASALESARKRPLRKGHAGVPGDGPAGETCGSCAHIARRQFAKVYIKCGLMQASWTGGGGTDVRVRDPACEKWAAPHA